MSLTQYNNKRDFKKTAEPKGTKKATGKRLRFVVQKHDASHLHYDFRLEMEGVLKSWAVPKGPSLNPEDKRLAMQVEDHPFDYRNFEGAIPEGEYGGGTVMVWDEGDYELMDADGMPVKDQEKELLRMLKTGNIKFELYGTKLKGSWALFRIRGREGGDRNWILMKHKDAKASQTDVLKKDKSVKSGLSMEGIAKKNGTVLKHPDGKTAGTKKKVTPVKGLLSPEELNETKPVKKAAKKAAAKKTGRTAAPKKAAKKKSGEAPEILKEFLEQISPAALPEDPVPMMASTIDEAFDGDQWLFEIKWDGYRALAFPQDGRTELLSRNGISFRNVYLPVVTALEELSLNAMLDGEIIALDEQGRPSFQKLQRWREEQVALQYHVFDILWYEGYDLTGLPLLERKKILKAILPEGSPVIVYSDHVVGQGIRFFEVAREQGLEGVMAKRCGSAYAMGQRTKDWLKIKTSLRQEVVIGGYTEPRNTRPYFGALMLGVYDKDGKLQYVGHTGSGFDQAGLKSLYDKLQPLIVAESPFANEAKANTKATWVKPKLVCEIKFTEWTTEGVARHPIFMGLRVDKKPKEVHREPIGHLPDEKKTSTMSTVKKASPAKKAAPKKAAPKKTSAKKASPKSVAGASSALIPPNEEDIVIKVDKQELQLTNLKKLYWKKEGFSKGDMLRYYHEIAPYMMPYMKDRPQSLNRHPNGIEGQNFYQKDVKGKVPDWIKTHVDYSESNGKNIEYLVCTNEATLLYMANLGCIEMHPWHSRVKTWDKPDWCLIDLDPSDHNTFDEVMETAKVTKQVLDQIGAECYMKTSGSTGIHIMIPLGARYTYEQSKQLAELIVTIVHWQLPELTSLERSPAKRKKEIYLDYLQNRQIQTAACAYSLRPKPGVPVSTPLHWEELKKGVKPTDFNAYNIFDRLKEVGDLFDGVLGKGIAMNAVLKKIESLM